MEKRWGKLVGLLTLLTIGLVLALGLPAEAQKERKGQNIIQASLVRYSGGNASDWTFERGKIQLKGQGGKGGIFVQGVRDGNGNLVTGDAFVVLDMRLNGVEMTHIFDIELTEGRIKEGGRIPHNPGDVFEVLGLRVEDGQHRSFATIGVVIQ